ncbi:MAG TPA: hypothetical protein VF808_15020 [Ktedonobacterales bacterium]
MSDEQPPLQPPDAPEPQLETGAPPPESSPPANSLPPGAPPPPLRPPASPPPGSRRQFILGILVGAIPLILALVGFGGNSNFTTATTSATFGLLLWAGGIGYVVALVLSIVLSAIQATRRFGLGMLTALLVSPVVFFISCLVIVTHPFPSGGSST